MFGWGGTFVKGKRKCLIISSPGIEILGWQK